MSTTLRVRPTLLRELGKIAAKSDQDVSEPAEDALRQFVRTHRETAHLTSTKANVRRLRSARAEIETEIARRRRNAASSTGSRATPFSLPSAGFTTTDEQTQKH